MRPIGTRRSLLPLPSTRTAPSSRSTSSTSEPRELRHAQARHRRGARGSPGRRTPAGVASSRRLDDRRDLLDGERVRQRAGKPRTDDARRSGRPRSNPSRSANRWNVRTVESVRATRRGLVGLLVGTVRRCRDRRHERADRRRVHIVQIVDLRDRWRNAEVSLEVPAVGRKGVVRQPSLDREVVEVAAGGRRRDPACRQPRPEAWPRPARREPAAASNSPSDGGGVADLSRARTRDRLVQGRPYDLDAGLRLGDGRRLGACPEQMHVLVGEPRRDIDATRGTRSRCVGSRSPPTAPAPRTSGRLRPRIEEPRRDLGQIGAHRRTELTHEHDIARGRDRGRRRRHGACGSPRSHRCRASSRPSTRR